MQGIPKELMSEALKTAASFIIPLVDLVRMMPGKWVIEITEDGATFKQDCFRVSVEGSEKSNDVHKRLLAGEEIPGIMDLGMVTPAAKIVNPAAPIFKIKPESDK
jgi:hypothetical protein